MNEIILNFSILLISGILISFLFGILSFPLSNYFYFDYKDKGFINGKIIGIFLVGFIYLSLVTISSFLPIHLLKLNSILTFLVSIALFIYFQSKFLNQKVLHLYKSINVRDFFISEGIFIILLSFFLGLNFLIRYDISSENLMNLGIFKQIQTQDNLPLNDFWLSGYYLNYYYFGHIAFSQYQLINKLDSGMNYFLISALIPALLGSSFLIFVSKYVKKYAFISLIILFGLTPIPAIVEYFNIPLSYSDKILEIFKNNSVRPIPQAISENFSYTFLNIPVHAHVFALLIGMVLIYQFKLIFDQKIFPNFFSKEYQFLFTLLGLIILTNTWDFVLYLGILAFILIFELHDKLKNNFKKMIIHLEGLILISIVISLPWFLFYQGPAIGISFVQNPSNFFQFFSFWQVYFFIFGSYITLNNFLFKEKFDRFLLILIFYSVSILLFIEIIFFIDATKGRWNTYYKFSNQILLIFSFISSIYFAKLLEINKTKLLNFLLLILIVFSASGPFIYFNYKYESKYLKEFYDANERIFSNNKSLFEAYLYLNKIKKTTQNETILEFSGFAYNQTNMLSALTGISSVMGWKNHEITWRLRKDIYEFVLSRENDIKEIYTGKNLDKAKTLIRDYKINYIVIGKYERENYHNLNYEKIGQLGTKLFENNSVQIYKIDP